MSLSGSLDIFPLPEVFRLLGRSGRTGQLSVETTDATGRIFVDSGGLTLATDVADDELRRRIALAESVAESVPEFVREHTIESLYRIMRTGHAFVFHLDERAPFDTGQRLDPKDAMEASERRAADWAEIEQVVPALDIPLVMQPELDGGQEIVLAASTWRFLARLNGGKSVAQLAEQTGSTEFHVAHEVAGLVRNGLVRLDDSPVVETPRYTETPRPTETPEHTGTDAPRTDGWWHDAIEEQETSEDSDTTDEDAGDFLDSVFEELDQAEDDEGATVTAFARGAIRRRLGKAETDADTSTDESAAI